MERIVGAFGGLNRRRTSRLVLFSFNGKAVKPRETIKPRDIFSMKGVAGIKDAVLHKETAGYSAPYRTEKTAGLFGTKPAHGAKSMFGVRSAFGRNLFEPVDEPEPGTRNVSKVISYAELQSMYKENQLAEQEGKLAEAVGAEGVEIPQYLKKQRELKFLLQ
jgi:hypothetical protein